jgi:hypothetical protein
MRSKFLLMIFDFMIESIEYLFLISVVALFLMRMIMF